MAVQLCIELKFKLEDVRWHMPCADVFLYFDYWPRYGKDDDESDEEKVYSVDELQSLPGVSYASQ